MLYRRFPVSFLTLVAWIALFVGLAVGTTAAQDATLRAEVDRTRITLDEQLLLEVTIEGKFRSVDEPARPPLEDFDVYQRGRSQGMQIVNGDFTASTTFTYVLVPKREGSFTIGSFVTKLGGKELRSAPIAITVGGGAGVRGAPSPGAGEPAEREDRDVFVVSRVDKQTAYVNEQILYTFYLYRAVQISNLNYSQPSFQGFWVEKLKDSEKQSYKMLNGRRYLVTELSTAIFPTTSGKLTVDAASLQLVVMSNPFGFSLFERGAERVLRTKAIDIDVAPLPGAGRPPIFDGAVGEGLTLSAKLDRTEVEEGEPITVSIAVEGSGNVKTFSKPRLPDLPGFKVYDADSKTEVQSIDRVFGSRKYEVVLVPKDEGEYTIGPVRMAYFDTREGRYRELQTKPLAVTAVRSSDPSRVAANVVLPRQQDIQILGKDIAHIRTDVPVSDDWRPLYAHLLFGALAPVPLLALLGVVVQKRKRDRLASDVALARSSRAHKLARKHLTRAQRALKAGEGEAFYAELSRALRQYVGDKLNVSPAGLTHDVLRARFTAAGLPPEICERLVQFLEHCDAARFAPGSYGGEQLREAVAEAEALLVTLDAGWRRGRKTPYPAALTLVIVALSAGAALAQAPSEPTLTLQDGSAPVASVQQGSTDFAPPADLLRRGHAAYESGDFTAAIAAYSAAERAGVRNGPLYYNLGNAYFKIGDLGRAIASYRRAEILAPRDRMLRSNLEYVLAQREDKAVQTASMPLVAAAQDAFHWLNVNEWMQIGLALYVLACALWVVRLLARGRTTALRLAVLGTQGLLVLCLVVLGFKIYSVHGIHRGVVSASRVAVMSGPGKDYTAEFSLHEGTEVRIESQRSEWLRISVGGKLHGWIPATSLVRI